MLTRILAIWALLLPFGSAQTGGSTVVAAGAHVLRVVAYDQRGPRFTEVASILEVPFTVEK
jgi:hypothetical protein